jgi:hypothetical protein
METTLYGVGGGKNFKKERKGKEKLGKEKENNNEN